MLQLFLNIWIKLFAFQKKGTIIHFQKFEHDVRGLKIKSLLKAIFYPLDQVATPVFTVRLFPLHVCFHNFNGILVDVYI